MTGLVIVAALIVLLIIALEPAHRRRSPLAPKPGEDLRLDADRGRTAAELRAARAVPPRTDPPARAARMLGRAGPAVPMHRCPPRLTEP